MTTDRKYLISIKACAEALEWLGDRSIVEAWSSCPRGEWMLWWAARCPAFVPGGDLHRRIGLAACEIARTALVRVPADELRPLRAIETITAHPQSTADGGSAWQEAWSIFDRRTGSRLFFQEAKSPLELRQALDRLAEAELEASTPGP